MRDAGWAAILLAGLVAVAGCTTFGAGMGTPTPTPSPHWPAELPPGVTKTHVAEPLDLARAHTAALVGYSFIYRATVTVSTPDGIPLGTVRTVRRVDADGRFVHRMRAAGVVPSAVTSLRAVDAYSDGSMTVIRYQTDGENRTLTAPTEEAAIAAYDVVQKGTIYSGLVTADPAVVGTLRRDGTAYLHLQGENGTVNLGLIRATNASFEALVTPSGLVHRYTLASHAVVTTDGGWEGRLVRTVVYEDVGATTVEQPAWVGGAMRNATDVPPGR